MKNFMTYTPRYYYGDSIEEDEMDGACSVHGKDEKCLQYFSSKT
jgi:hypothetical protein